jgi:hypothetical protein
MNKKGEKSQKALGEDSWSLGQDVNHMPPEHTARMIPIRPLCSVEIIGITTFTDPSMPELQGQPLTYN